MKAKGIYLENDMLVPNICYGPGMICNNFKSIQSYCSKKLLKESFVDLKKVIATNRIVKNEKELLFIDTASAYGYAEKAIGQAIAKKKREKVIICTKVSARDQIKNGKQISKACSKSLQQLGISVIDLYLMHWPVSYNYIEVWKQMEELYYRGKVRAIGVCNCHIHHLEEIMSHCMIKPMVNQIEIHPLFTQERLSAFCKDNNIQVMAYTPLARNDDRLTNSQILQKIAKRYHKAISQVILRWHIQLGNIPVVATNSINHWNDDNDIFDFELKEEEMKAISSLNLNSRLRYDSDNCNFMEL